jgi:acetolactate synthase-1/2/3 large subunit
VFGLPGEELRDILFSLRDSAIKFVTVRHEQGAAFMADVYGRVSGKAGICLSTLGPGATNLVTGIADANLDHAPMVAITAQGSLERLHKESHQIIDIVDMFRPITKWNTRISSPKIIAEAVRKAFKIAETEKPGATHLEIPEDVSSMETSGKPLHREKLRRAAPDHKAVHKALEVINSSMKPLVLAGNGAIRKLASNQLRLFVEKTRIPVVSTFMGKGAISDKSEYSLMSLGLGTPKEMLRVIDSADLIIAIGYDIAELDPRKWNRNNKRILHIDFSPAEVYEYYQPEIEVVADISNTLWHLNKEIVKEFDFPEAKSYREKFIATSFVAMSDGSPLSDSFPMHPRYALAKLRNALSNDSLIISDVGAHKMWIGAFFPAYERGSVIISNGLASMGLALPGAIGAKLASPTTDVVAVVGDGGFLMNVQELETAVRLSLDFTIILFNDNSYSLIDAKFMNDRKETFATDLSNPDFKKLSESFGCKYYSARRDMESVFAEALSGKGVKIVEVAIDKSKNSELFG